MKILIIEDDQATAGFMAKGLKESGHVTDHAADGEDGFEFARHGDYDVCVVDRMLPKLDGLTLVERLRAERAPGAARLGWRQRTDARRAVCACLT